MLTQDARQTLRLDSAWKFHLGDIPATVPNTHIAAYMANKAGWSRGAAKGDFDDSDWPVLDLPHDWSVEGKFDPANHVDAGFLPRGIAWYRRHFRLEESDRRKHLALQFDGVATHCTVYVNGHQLHRNFCGYTPFTIDITDVANFGDQLNVISVRVDATYMEGWWYEGAGIYRHVWLIKTAPVHFIPNGVSIQPRRGDRDSWDCFIQTTISNRTNQKQPCSVYCEIQSAVGELLGEVATAVSIAAGTEVHVSALFNVISPQLWDLSSPNLYKLNARIQQSNQVLDQVSTTFGFRTIRFDAAEGFFLNDRPVKLKGTCNHQDHAGVGVAVPDSIQRFRIQRLLDMGSNAYRCAHNPPAPELLDACDELGMLVIDETRNFGSSPQHLDQLQSMILRDRNHPCIILWSICNEEPVQGTSIGANIARSMQRVVKHLDPSRPVTAAVSGGMLNDNCIADVIEVMGTNYQLSTYVQYHAKHPQTPLLASETHCALTTRGIYKTDPERHVFDSFDQEKATWGTTARAAWGHISKQPFVAGMFAWTGFDYRGEPSPHQWPSINSHWGILDMCGFAKDSFYLHKAFFTTQPFVHILPHWNWPGLEGQPIRVVVYTNCKVAELSLNGQSVGRKNVDPIEMAEWAVPYQPGMLRAIAFDNETAVAEQSVATTGAAVSLGLEFNPAANARSFPADGECAIPITAFATDSEGRRGPIADHFITFSVSGPAKILGVGNGDPNCHEPDKASARSLFQGLAQVILQTTTSPGKIQLKATAPGLATAVLELETSTASIRPSVPPATVRYLVQDWMMSRITPDRPDPNQQIAEQDMNSWERINPANGFQEKWREARGYAVYRANFRLPKTMQASGGRLVFREVAGVAEVYLNGVRVHERRADDMTGMEIPVRGTVEKVMVSVLFCCEVFPAGLGGSVELLA